jgi:Flp pilus assembly protein TadB
MKKLGAQTTSRKTRQSHSRRKNNPPLRAVRTGGKRTKSSPDSRKISEERCEYALNTDGAKWYATISGALSAFFLIMFLTTTSLWHVVLLVLPLLCSLGLFYAIVLNQRVILHRNTITILRRMQKPITSSVADALYQIRAIRGTIPSFIFRFDNGRKVARITPQAYKNGDKLLQQLEDIIDHENIDVDIIER